MTDSVGPDDSTRGVKILRGDPKKAILKLSLPMIVAMSVQTVYNVVDAIWVSGLGADALSAVGFFFPFFFMIMALSTGLGVGGGSAISRRIGAHDKEGANTVAVHTIIIMAILAISFSIPLYGFIDDIFYSMGAGNITSTATEYARIIFAGAIIIFFSNIGNALLRGEGDATRAMYALMIGAGLNIVLDPIFIYVLDLGVAGAAWATMTSICTAALILFYWIFIKKDTYISIHFHHFTWDSTVIKEILQVGLPSAVMQLSMSFAVLILNMIVVQAGGTDGIAVYTTGWRVATFGSLPLIGIATAVTAVTGAAYGSRDYNKLDTAFLYAVKTGIKIEIIIALIIFLLAPQITLLFTLSEDAARISGDLIIFLRTMVFYFPTVSIGMLSSAMFQGTGRGINSLIATIIRTLLLTVPLSYLLALYLGIGLPGVWWGIVIGNVTGSVIAFIWARIYIAQFSTQLSSAPQPE
jgi:putative MATE family efflux protein